MNYKKIYWDLIKKAIARQYSDKPLKISEIHHIIPREHNGSNASWNKVQLKIREHIIAHMLLGRFTTTAYKVSTMSSRELAKIRMRNICTGVDRNGHKVNYYNEIRKVVKEFKHYDELKLMLEWFVNQNILAGQEQKCNLNISKVFMKNMLVYFSKNFEIPYEEE
ncbi:MAG: HNH endonuclease [Clostridia bacterium]|nr:HNH endonuclease [Clostridia bacterium]